MDGFSAFQYLIAYASAVELPAWNQRQLQVAMDLLLVTIASWSFDFLVFAVPWGP